jgi:hypothetical protein
MPRHLHMSTHAVVTHVRHTPSMCCLLLLEGCQHTKSHQQQPTAAASCDSLLHAVVTLADPPCLVFPSVHPWFILSCLVDKQGHSLTELDAYPTISSDFSNATISLGGQC